MNTQPLYVVNAFTNDSFGGNPAAICPLDTWLPDDTMQKMAAQHNVSETAFFIPTPDSDTDFHIRWFTPTHEVELCGHATLAAAHVILNELDYDSQSLNFHSQVGKLNVTSDTDNKLTMNFPQGNFQPTGILGTYHAVFGSRPAQAFTCPTFDDTAKDLVLFFDTEEQVTDIEVNFKALSTLNDRCFIITAPSNDDNIDFVCRVFAPSVGIEEDPVTGSAFTLLTPLWAQKLADDGLEKTNFVAKQVSARSGDVWSGLLADKRVSVAGFGRLYSRGEVYL